MGVPFFGGQTKKRNQVVAIDLGARTTKAVHLERDGERFRLVNFVIQDAPTGAPTVSSASLTEHLRAVTQALGAKSKQVVLAVGVADSLLRQADMPQVPVADMRMMLKLNAKNYLQQDLPDHVFDCFVLPTSPTAKPAEGAKGSTKFKVLVGGAKRGLITDLQAASRAAGLTAELIIPGILGPINAFELAQPEVFAKEVAALVEIGFKHSTVSILLNGELVLSRVVSIGGEKLTHGLAEAMGIGEPEAEGIKIGMPGEVQPMLQALLSPLGRELRASIDFFEHQHDKTVGQVFVSGASARSEVILQGLQGELMVPCKAWNPTEGFQLALPPQAMTEIEAAAPQLAVALGAAAAEF